jgi:hypothetical protein
VPSNRQDLRPVAPIAPSLARTKPALRPASPLQPRARSPPSLAQSSPPRTSLSRTSLASPVALAPSEAQWLDFIRDWILSYSDPRPYTLDSIECRLFLLTNAGYFVAGALVAGIGNALPLGLSLELACSLSVWYHYEQCRRGGTRDPIVQTAMAFDYAAALPTLASGLFYAIDLGPDHVPYRALTLMALAFAALAGGWICSKPRQYFALHGMWHVLGAAAAAELASWHAQFA